MMPALVQVLVNTRHARKRPSKKRTAAKWLGRDAGRALIACLLLGSLFGLGHEIIVGDLTKAMRSGSATPSGGEDKLTAASMLLVPRLGNECRLRQIDNATWRVMDLGVVECNTVNESKSSTPSLPTARIDGIRHAFRNR